MDLSTFDWKAINQTLQRLYRELDAEKHSRVMFETINSLIPSDSIALQSAHRQTPLNLSARTWPENHSTPDQIRLIGQYAHQSPYAAYYLSTMDANWKMITDFMPLEEFYQTDLHRLALKPLGVNHQIFGMLGFFEETVYALVINRTNSEFSERDREVLNTIHPHLVNSFFNALVFGRAKDSIGQLQTVMETVPGAYAYFDGRGHLSWIQTKAEAWLKDFFPSEPRDGKVPATIKEFIHSSASDKNALSSFEKVQAGERLVVCLGSSVLGGWILRLERKPATPTPHFRPLPQLSQRENEVLRWMVEGKRNSEIGKIIHLSARTVENHVQNILEKLMVENRATAIVRAMEYCAAVSLGMLPAIPPAA